MNCLKCGRETNRDQVFCGRCLDSMAAYPVKPGTPVHLPKRPITSLSRKTPRRRNLSPEEQVVQLKKRSNGLIAALVVLILLLGLAVGALVYTGNALRAAKNTGKNFTVETTPPSTEDVSRETSGK